PWRIASAAGRGATHCARPASTSGHSTSTGSAACPIPARKWPRQPPPANRSAGPRMPAASWRQPCGSSAPGTTTSRSALSRIPGAPWWRPNLPAGAPTWPGAWCGSALLRAGRQNPGPCRFRDGGSFPSSEPPVLSRTDFQEWGERYLDCDPDSRTRSPAAVKVPSGAFQDIFDAWAGRFPCDLAAIRSPVAIIRGAWDGMCGDDDAAWLRQSLTASAEVRDIVIPRATHLMHLESGRCTLYRETEAFLAAQ